MKIIKGADKGFFANCNDAARHISQCLINNETWYIQWGSEMPYYDDSVGNNAWEYFFKQIYNNTSTNFDAVSDYVDLVILKDSFRKTMNFIYKNYILLNDKLINVWQLHFNFFDTHDVLGVHIRKTDKHMIGMYGTTNKTAPVDLAIFIKEIDSISNKFEYIFLATDCIETCKILKERYGQKLLLNKEAFRSNQTLSIHHNFKNISGYKKGLDVLSDAYFLSKCKHLIRSSSNVSVTALYLNLNLTFDNLNVKYYGDCENSIL